MKKIATWLTIVSLCVTLNIQAQVGTWKTYMAYHNVTQIEKAGNLLYVLASNNLYAYNTNDQSIVTFDKSTSLNDTEISKIAWCNAAKRLIVVYSNANIDLVNLNGTVINMPEYYNKSMTEDKAVNDIYVYNEYAYLSTPFGIIKINVSKAEISDTYMLGFGVNHTYIENGKIYAASPTAGIYNANLNTNLLDKNNWTYSTNYIAKNQTIDPTLQQTIANLKPGGPKHNHFGVLKFINNKLYTAGGGYLAEIDNERDGTIQVWNGNDWQIYDSDIAAKTTHPYVDIMTIDVDPKDENHVMAGSRGGLYEFQNGQFVKEWSYDNSLLQSSFTNDKNYVIIKGVKYDNQGNLWILNSYTPSQSIVLYDKEKQWHSFHKPELMQTADKSLHHMTSLIQDSRSLLWFVNNYWSKAGLFAYQPSTDALSAYQTFNNQDGTRVNVEYVRCVAEDIDQNLWIGTNVGPLMLRASDIANTNASFYQPKIPRNDGTNFADYLLAGVDISAIAIDGAGRKWFGTNGNGAYLISKDNLTQVQHFTAENSTLLSNVIEAITINPTSGEVFFGTNKGLCSYMSDAATTQNQMTKETVWAYPNPVTPQYQGLITITGLTLDADVKIVTANGSLVAEGRSNGGLFTWDGNDKKGKRVASGVYMVQTAMADGSKGTVCKIAIVN